MARPNWEYIRVDVRLPRHRKLIGATAAVKWTLIELWCLCGEELSDGFVPDALWTATGRERSRDELVRRGFAVRVHGGYVMHDYLEHQRSRDEVDDLRQKRSASGRKGGLSKASAKQVPEQTPGRLLSKPLAEAEAEAEAEADLAVAEVAIQSNGSSARTHDRDQINALIIKEIGDATGRIVTVEWAEKITGHILKGRNPSDPAAYIRQVIRNDPDPRKRFLPVY